jgi:hypothetical protein
MLFYRRNRKKHSTETGDVANIPGIHVGDSTGAVTVNNESLPSGLPSNYLSQNQLHYGTYPIIIANCLAGPQL